MNINTQFLNSAEGIAKHICSSAYWFDRRCNWIGNAVTEISPGNNSIFTKSLSCDVYDGTSGIALFLLALYGYTKRQEYLETIEGAVNHSLSNAKKLHHVGRFSFFTGKLGIAYVSLKVGYDLGLNYLTDQGIELLKGLQKDFEKEHLLDVISGNASGIPTLLSLYIIFRDEHMLELAILLGDELIKSSKKGKYGISWNDKTNGIKSSLHNLTGFSHGTAGIGCSLLELYKITKENIYKDAAENAFSYENHWFNKQINNWPDFRSNSLVDANRLGFKYATAWCHGAPGIGLSRIRAFHLLKDPKYLLDSNAAINTSIQVLEKAIKNSNFDFSLCHGLSGVCETLLYADKIFGTNLYKSMLRRIGLYGIKKYGKEVSYWPCGIKNGVTPGLMLGLAGIGYFYLQLTDSSKISNPLMMGYD
ncbi:MAG: lanthionine synthetase LanC family protein [Candidatus Nitrosocosmicus sp.]